MLRLSGPDLFSRALLGRLRELLVRPGVEDDIGRGSGLTLPFPKGRREPARDESDAAFFTVTTEDDVELDREALLWWMAVADVEFGIPATVSGGDKDVVCLRICTPRRLSTSCGVGTAIGSLWSVTTLAMRLLYLIRTRKYPVGQPTVLLLLMQAGF